MSTERSDSDAPEILEPSGSDDGMRDRASGRFVKGHPGIGGRPKGVDFRALIRERKGLGTLEDALVSIFDALSASARKGDVQAAKLLLDRLTEDDASGKANGMLVRLITGIDEGAA